MQQILTPYEDLLKHVWKNGVLKNNRTGIKTRSYFGAQLRYDLSVGFPLITTKKVHFKSIVYELLWFLKGKCNNKWLIERGVSIWNEWADSDGSLGPIYGVQWRSWPSCDNQTIDQIANVINLIKTDPDSRRMIVSAWNVAQLDEMALYPCHVLFQFYVANNKLSCQLYQRSADLFLGVPFNIASYALLTHMIAQQTSLEVGEFIWTGGDCHIYENHLSQVEIQLSRTANPYPILELVNKKSIDDYELDDVILHGYAPHPALKAIVAV